MRYLSAEIWRTPEATVRMCQEQIDGEIPVSSVSAMTMRESIILSIWRSSQLCGLLLEKEKVHREEFEALFTTEKEEVQKQTI